MEPKKLIICDIDSTLVEYVEEHRVVYGEAFDRVYGVPNELNIGCIGQTTHQIFVDVLVNKYGRNEAEVRAKLPEVDRVLVEAMERELKKLDKSKALPGAKSFLEEAVRRGHVLSIGTGNPRKYGELLLSHSGLFDYFRLGAFGCEAEIRKDVFQLAIEKARKHYAIDDVFVVGDSPNDVFSGVEVGAKVFYVPPQSRKHSDDHGRAITMATGVFSGLTEYRIILDLIG